MSPPSPLADAPELIRDHWISTIQVEPTVDCWTWNGTHGRLSSRDSSMPGPWSGDIVPYVRHWHDLISARKLGPSYLGERDPWAHLTEQIWLVWATQTTKTRSGLYAALGYLVDQHSSPKGLVLPRRKDYKRVLDNRVRPFFEETPRLHRHFPAGKRQQTVAITYEAWTLNPCTIYFMCGEVADDLRSFPICDLFLDEFDLLPANVEGQGDPIDLVLDSQKTWPRQKLTLGATTPTTLDGQGWRRLCSGSHERLFVRCPKCGADQELHPDQLVWPESATPDAVKAQDLARWACKHCKTQYDTKQKDKMVREAGQADRWVAGKWAVSADSPGGLWTPAGTFNAQKQIVREMPKATIRSGQMNSLYSQFVSLSAFVHNELVAKLKGTADSWTAHLNGWRCEPSLPVSAINVSTTGILENTSVNYGRGSCPKGGIKLVLTLDQQGNTKEKAWFPFVARAWGPRNESWLVDCGEVHGWEELEMLCDRQWTVGGDLKRADVVSMDCANGNLRVATQEWATREPDRRILLRGYQIMDVPHRRRQADSRGKRLLAGVVQYYFHSTGFKTDLGDIISRDKGPKLWHLPSDAPDYYLKSLTSEEKILEQKRLPNEGWREIYIWQPRAMYDETGRVTLRTDNHWWDCETMALVVADIYQWTNLPPPSTPAPADTHRKETDSWDSAVESY